MAEQQQPIEDGNIAANGRGGESEFTSLGTAASAVTLSFLAAASIVSRIWEGMTADGMLAAAARQGSDEIGVALKAFPDSVQTQEVGSIWNPTSGGNHQFPASRLGALELDPLLQPHADGESEQYVHGQQNDQDNGHRHGHSM